MIYLKIIKLFTDVVAIGIVFFFHNAHNSTKYKNVCKLKKINSPDLNHILLLLLSENKIFFKREVLRYN